MAVYGVSSSRRLPGFSFEVQAPPLTDALPRMDVAVFVGFAASGPLHRPVAVEDTTQFHDIFGDDLPLAWDDQRGEQVYSYLGPAVRSFFRNGGRRCWIVRVAGTTAQYNYIPLPGLAQVDMAGNLVPAFARARSEGSWSDGLQASCDLLSLPVVVASLTIGDGKKLTADLAPASPGDIVEGDLLRLTFPQQQAVAFCTVQAMKTLKPAATNRASPTMSNGAPFGQGTIRVVCDEVRWFVPVAQPVVPPEQAVIFSYAAASGVQEQSVAVLDYTVSAQPAVTVTVSVAPEQTPDSGSYLRLDADGQQVLVMAQSVEIEQIAGSPPIDTVQIAGIGFTLAQTAPPIPPNTLPFVEKLTFELWARLEDGTMFRLSDLGFAAQHPRYWGTLPTDEQLYSSTVAPSSLTPVSLWQAKPPDTANTTLWHDAGTPRFPLAGNDEAGTALPLGMAVLPQQYLPAVSSPLDALLRDGLGSFDASLFVDDRMADARVTELMARATYLRYQAQTLTTEQKQTSEEQPLRGIYAALDVEEATLIAVPDAVQRAWQPSAFLNVLPVQDVPGSMTTGTITNELPARPAFVKCYQPAIAPPRLLALHPPDAQGSFTLGWSQDAQRVDAEIIYMLEEATDGTFEGAVTIYTGKESEVTLYRHQRGRYFYRVRAAAGGLISAYSNGLIVSISDVQRWLVSEQVDTSTLLAVQRALLRLCTARGDISALLTLPEQYLADQAIAHIASLKSPVDTGEQTSVPPLSLGESSVFSYGSLYHPWLYVNDDPQSTATSRVPPDGAICGMIAQRAQRRGAWVAPANVPLLDAVGLTTTIQRANWLRLQDLQLNLIRQEPRGIVVLNADTLSDDEDLRPLNVRRLLILLRRMAQRQGIAYVFEPNSNAFRRMVERSFEDMLESMFRRGAFAGNTPATSFQVVVDGVLNTPQGMDQGRFLVELRVAPSLPLTFLTIRLVLQSNGGATITEVS